MNFRLSSSDRKAIARQLMADINAASVAHFAEPPRDHLGASEIGEPCARRLVYAFRWMHRENFTGAMHRLFRRGHQEEANIELWLRLAGCVAKTHDENGKQLRIPTDGHFGGSLDGQVRLPEHYNLPITFLLEMKTHNQKSFDKLLKDGVKLSKPKHFSQMCVYGEAFNLDYAVYFAVNKNTDEIQIEIVEIDRLHGRGMRDKAAIVISSKQLPHKIAATSAYWACKFCPMSGICHDDQLIDVNCRSCRFSTPETSPEAGSQWFCHHWQAFVPHDFISQGCGHWQAFK